MITSTKNDFIKSLKKLETEKDVMVLDSKKLILEAKQSGYEILHLLKLESEKDVFTDNDIIVSSNVLKAFKNTVTSQGVVALIKFETKKVEKPKTNFLVLENVQDPGNVGTLIRSAVGANFLDIYLLGCASVTSAKVVRSTMGAIFKANLYKVDDSFYETVKTFDCDILIADMIGDDIHKTKIKNKCGVVIGNEGSGVSKQIEELATKKVCIKMQNNLESLNAAVSGSIIMYQISNSGV